MVLMGVMVKTGQLATQVLEIDFCSLECETLA